MIFHTYHPLIRVIQPSMPTWVPSSMTGKWLRNKKYYDVTKTDNPLSLQLLTSTVKSVLSVNIVHSHLHCCEPLAAEV